MVLQSDYNAFDLPTSSHVAGAQLFLQDKSLEEWQIKSGHDANSFVQSPFEPASPGAGVWFGSEESLNPDMHFTSFPGEIYLAPPVPGVTTDIDGANRGETLTLIGADEILQPAAVDGWIMY